MDATPRVPCRTPQEAALRLAAEVDPVARQIGAVNTLVRQPDGSFKGYNTDWLAAIQVGFKSVKVLLRYALRSCNTRTPCGLECNGRNRPHLAPVSAYK